VGCFHGPRSSPLFITRRFFERVLLLIRNIANPSEEDQYFPTWRHKDWYQGHSWASGIAMPYLNGKNQESSSESIAAYEAVAVYGGVMVRWKYVMSLSHCEPLSHEFSSSSVKSLC
jgi:Glycosyl hydrolase family 81 C-terminal domain